MSILKIIKNYFHHLNKNVFFLAIAQIFSMTSMNINMISSGLAGFLIAPYGWMSTLPLSLQFVSSMLATFPASLLMSKFGRKPIFLIGSVFILLSGIIMGISIMYKTFTLFCLGSMFLGVGHSISQFYRYAATETVDKNVRPKAMSLVIAAGLIAAILGPEISKITASSIINSLYAASFFSIALTQIISIPFILSIKIPIPKKSISGGSPISKVFLKTGMIKAIISAAGGYSIMTYLMTATPLQIVNICNFGISTNAIIIQWHVVAMFAPSFFTGSLIQKFKAETIIFLGILAYISMIFFALIAIKPFHYFIALFLLGIGWNFLFLGGSSLIVSLIKPEEQGKVQGLADLIIFSSVAIASLTAGFLHYSIGWDKMVIGVIPIIIIIIITNFNYSMIKFFFKRGIY